LAGCDLSQPSVMESEARGRNDAVDGGDRSPMTKAVKRGPQPGSPAGVLARSPHSKFDWKKD
jgi:hypothetical protein